MRHSRMFSTFLIFAVAATVVVAGDAPGELYDPDMEGVTAPKVIAGSQTRPVYPPAALDARMTGSVLLAAVVHQDGSVGEVSVLGTDHPRLGFEEAAADALRTWRFRPASFEGEPVDSYTVITLRFNDIGTRLDPRPYVDSVFIPDFDALTGIDLLADGRLASGLPGAGGNHTMGFGSGRDLIKKCKLPPRSGLYDRSTLVPPREIHASQPTPIGSR